MAKVLIIAEHADGQLNPSVAKCVACAATIPEAEIDVALFSASGEALADQIAGISSVSRVIRVDADVNANALTVQLAPQVAALASGYTHLLGPSTTFGKDLMPTVAALLGVNQVSDVMEVVAANRFKKPIYAGNAILTVETPEGMPVVATVRTASYQAAAEGGSATVESVTVQAEIPSHSRFIERKIGASDRPDLQTAAKVVSGGRALASAENFELIYKLADTLGAAVGASRAAVDAGYVPNEMQVGQTGKIIAPDLYIAIGISGAIQHLTGIKDAGTIVAINKDAEAPIFEVSDIGLVGDLFKVVPELEAALSS